MTCAMRCGTSVSAAVGLGGEQQRKENAEDDQQDQQNPQDPAETLLRLGIAFPRQLVLAVIGRE